MKRRDGGYRGQPLASWTLAEPAGLRRKPALPLGLMALGGAVCGLLVPILLGLGKWWALFALLGLAAPVVAILSGDVKRLLVLLLALILPMNPDIHFFQEQLRISLSSLIGLALWGIWLLEQSSEKKTTLRLFPKTSLPAVAFVVVTLMSILANTGTNYLPLLRSFEPLCDFLVYLYLANYIRTEEELRDIVLVLLLGALLQCVTAIAELWIHIELDLLFTHAAVPLWQQEVGIAQYSRISGLMEHANMLGIYLSSMIVVVVSSMFADDRRGVRLVYGAGTAIGVYVIVNTFSRSAWFVFAVSVPTVAAIYLWKLRSLGKGALAIGAVALVTLSLALLSPAKIVDRLTVDESVTSRQYMMEIGWNVVRENPLMGVGFGNYMRAMYSYDDTDIAISSIFPGIIHNIYVLIAAEQGILGLLAFLWLNYAIWVTGWRFVRSEVDFLNNMGLAFFCVILMFLVYGMVNPFPRFTYIYVLLGMLVATRAMTDGEGARPDRGTAAETAG